MHAVIPLRSTDRQVRWGYGNVLRYGFFPGKRRSKSEGREQAPHDHRAAAGAVYPFYHCPYGEDLAQAAGESFNPLSPPPRGLCGE